MGQIEFRRPCPPLQAPRLFLHSNQEGHEVSSVLALPCFRHCGSVGYDGEGAKGTPTTQSIGYPLVSMDTVRGAARTMSATGPVAGGSGHLRRRDGDRRRGIARLLQAAEMRAVWRSR